MLVLYSLAGTRRTRLRITQRRESGNYVRRIGSEEELAFQVSHYLRLQYPKVLFHFDYGSGLKMTMGQAVRQKQLNPQRSWPDLFIAKPVIIHRPGEDFSAYHGYFIELKREGTTVFRKDGKVVSNPHIFEQWGSLQQLRQLGYKADFGIGYEQTIELIDSYLEGTL